MNEFIAQTLLISVILSLFCLGIYNLVMPGRIFGFVLSSLQDIEREIETLESEKKSQESELKMLESGLRYPSVDLTPQENDTETQVLILKYKDVLSKTEEAILFKRSILFFTKPMFMCPPCMASVWGSVGFLSLKKLFSPDKPLEFYDPQFIAQWIASCVIACFINWVLYLVQSKLDQ